MRVAITAAVAAIVSLTACGHAKIDELTKQVTDLQGQIETLTATQADICMMTAEMSSGGIMVYLGDDIWLNRMTGEVAKFPTMRETCMEAALEYRTAVDGRVEMKAYAQEKLKDAPVVVE